MGGPWCVQHKSQMEQGPLQKPSLSYNILWEDIIQIILSDLADCPRPEVTVYCLSGRLALVKHTLLSSKVKASNV